MPVTPSARRRATCLAALAPLAIGAPARAQSGEHAGHAASRSTDELQLGRVNFPTSATPAAHAQFERGVLYLHNFHYPQAAWAFARAHAIDSLDVMSAAFQALSHTHAVWNEQDTAAARAALRSLAPTRAARLALARTPRERGWLDAVEALYDGDTPKPVRDTAFARAMAGLHAADPSDPEAATFYAVALLGLHQGEREARAYAQAEAIVDTVLRAHPRHPGALHYKIHAVDDPQNAARGLDAARAYGKVAPAASHALHMTSHIYIALGMWNDVVAANRRAQWANGHVFGHYTHWLEYGLLQLGSVPEARAWVDSMLSWKREPGDAGARASRGAAYAETHAILMAATYVVDAEAWDSPPARTRPDTSAVRSIAVRTLGDFYVGYAAARRSDRALADSMLARMTSRTASAPAADGPDATDLAQAQVLGEVLRAELLAADGQGDSAVAVLTAAAARLEALPFAFGPPVVAKPPRERAAELLLELGRPDAALAQLELAERTAPGRRLARIARERSVGR